MLIETLKNAALVIGLAMLAAVIVAGLREELAARRRCQPVHTIVGFRQVQSGYADGSESPECGWFVVICLVVVVLALVYALMHVAVAAGF